MADDLSEEPRPLPANNLHNEGFRVVFETAPSVTPSALPTARSGACVVHRNNQHIYFGGLDDFEALLADVAVYDIETRQWSYPTIQGVPPRAAFGVGATLLSDGTILFCGGQCFEPFPAQTFVVLDLDAKQWIEQDVYEEKRGAGTSADVAQTFFRWGHSVIAVPRELHSDVIGSAATEASDVLLIVLGDAAQSQRDIIAVWRRSSNPTKWYAFQRNAGPEKLVPRRRHVCALYQREYIIMYGGRTMDKRATICNADLWIYSISANIWAKIEHNTPPYLVHAFLDARALGLKASLKRKNQIDTQKVAANAIMSFVNRPSDGIRSPWPLERTGHVGFLRADKFWIATGFRPAPTDVQTFNDVWCFDLATVKWTEVQPFDPTEQVTVPLPYRPPELGFRPNSMSTITPLSHDNNGTYMYFGGRLKERALHDVGTVHFVQPKGPSLAALVRRQIFLSALRRSVSSAILDQSAPLETISDFISVLNASLPEHLKLHVEPIEASDFLFRRRSHNRAPGEIG